MSIIEPQKPHEPPHHQLMALTAPMPHIKYLQLTSHVTYNLYYNNKIFVAQLKISLSLLCTYIGTF